jgi:hypothetical protein
VLPVRPPGRAVHQTWQQQAAAAAAAARKCEQAGGGRCLHTEHERAAACPMPLAVCLFVSAPHMLCSHFQRVTAQSLIQSRQQSSSYTRAVTAPEVSADRHPQNPALLPAAAGPVVLHQCSNLAPLAHASSITQEEARPRTCGACTACMQAAGQKRWLSWCSSKQSLATPAPSPRKKPGREPVAREQHAYKQQGKRGGQGSAAAFWRPLPTPAPPPGKKQAQIFADMQGQQGR